MSKKILIEVRTNTNFSVNYDTMSLVPQVELILLMQEPRYKVVRKGEETFIKKDIRLGEFRCVTTLQELNELIGQLQLTAAALLKFEHMAVGLNKVIEQAKVTEQPKEQ